MLFKNCENCSNVGVRVCGCGDAPRFYCDSHVIDHLNSSGKHSIESAVENLSTSQVSSIRDAYNSYRFSSIRQAVQLRNSRIEILLLKIRKAEEECSSMIERILSGQIAKDIEEVLFYNALPLCSDSPVVRSLLGLKHALNLSDFSSPPIHEMLKSLSSVSSQISTTQTIDLKNYRWELLNQTKAHKKDIYSLAVSDCERYIASASEDETINIWEFQTLSLLYTLKGHTGYVFSVAFLGNKIISGSSDRSIKVWEEDRCVNTLNKHSGSVSSMCVSSSNRLIASGSGDRTVVLFRSEDYETLHVLAHSYYVKSVAFSEDAKEVVSGTGYGEIWIWKTKTGEHLKTLKAHSDLVTCVKFSEKFIVSSSVDKTVKIWDRDKDEPLLTFTEHTESVNGIDTRDNIVLSLGDDNRLIIRDIRNGTVIQTLEANGESLDCGFTIGLKVLQGGKFIVSGAGDRNLNVWRRLN